MKIKELYEKYPTKQYGPFRVYRGTEAILSGSIPYDELELKKDLGWKIEILSGYTDSFRDSAGLDLLIEYAMDAKRYMRDNP